MEQEEKTTETTTPHRHYKIGIGGKKGRKLQRRTPDEIQTIRRGNNSMTLYIRDVPKDIKQRFHAMCVARGKTLSGAIIQYMREAVRDKKM